MMDKANNEGEWEIREKELQNQWRKKLNGKGKKISEGEIFQNFDKWGITLDLPQGKPRVKIQVVTKSFAK